MRLISIHVSGLHPTTLLTACVHHLNPPDSYISLCGLKALSRLNSPARTGFLVSDRALGAPAEKLILGLMPIVSLIYSSPPESEGRAAAPGAPKNPLSELSPDFLTVRFQN